MTAEVTREAMIDQVRFEFDRRNKAGSSEALIWGAILRELEAGGWRAISEEPPLDNIVDLYAVHDDGHGTRIPAGRWLYGEWWSNIGPIRPPWRVTHYNLILAPPTTSDGQDK